MCIYLYVCVYKTHVYVYLYIYIYIYMYTHRDVCVCIFVYILIHMYTTRVEGSHQGLVHVPKCTLAVKLSLFFSTLGPKCTLFGAGAAL